MMNKRNKNEFVNINRRLEELFSENDKVEKSSELNYVVEQALLEGEKMRFEKKSSEPQNKLIKVVFAVFCSVILMVNISPVFARTMYTVPLVGNICKFFTFREYHFMDDIKYVNIKIPEFVNTGKSELEKKVNREIRYFVDKEMKSSERDAKDYYEAFIATGGKKEDFQPMGITIDYEVYCANRDIVSFSVLKWETTFSAYNSKIFYNIDMETGRYLTIKDYLGNDYIKIVLSGIKNHLATWSSSDKELLWKDLDFKDLINEKTNYYIDENKNVVIVFDKYEIGVGALGEVEIPIIVARNK